MTEKPYRLPFHRDDLAAVLIIIFLYGLMQLAGITCPIRYFTGISCAGCGMTRAWIRVFHLQFHEAFSYHPLFLLPLPTLVWILMRRKIRPRIWNTVMAMIVTIFLVVYVIRLLDPSDRIVTADITQGRLWMLGRMLLSRIHF
ncbi:MAG: DUF2752 domain-containing protein [Eubacterium sp.]|nr:DUF2752 domain-containing protein [Eubacterium sp.]